MHEPDFSRLAFAPRRDLWRAYLETATTDEAVDFLRSGKSTQPVVWIETAAVEAHRAESRLSYAQAFVAMAQGVYLAMAREAFANLPERHYRLCIFPEAPLATFAIGVLDGCLMVHLHRA